MSSAASASGVNLRARARSRSRALSSCNSAAARSGWLGTSSSSGIVVSCMRHPQSRRCRPRADRRRRFERQHIDTEGHRQARLRVEIDGERPVPALRQRRADIERARRLRRAALLVEEGDHRHRVSVVRLVRASGFPAPQPEIAAIRTPARSPLRCPYNTRTSDAVQHDGFGVQGRGSRRLSEPLAEAKWGVMPLASFLHRGEWKIEDAVQSWLTTRCEKDGAAMAMRRVIGILVLLHRHHRRGLPHLVHRQPENGLRHHALLSMVGDIGAR